MPTMHRPSIHKIDNNQQRNRIKSIYSICKVHTILSLTPFAGHSQAEAVHPVDVGAVELLEGGRVRLPGPFDPAPLVD